MYQNITCSLYPSQPGHPWQDKALGCCAGRAVLAHVSTKETSDLKCLISVCCCHSSWCWTFLRLPRVPLDTLEACSCLSCRLWIWQCLSPLGSSSCVWFPCSCSFPGRWRCRHSKSLTRFSRAGKVLKSTSRTVKVCGCFYSCLLCLMLPVVHLRTLYASESRGCMPEQPEVYYHKTIQTAELWVTGQTCN